MKLSDAGLILVVLVVAWIIYRAQIGPRSFDLMDILLENGRVSKWNCIIISAFALTSWQMVRLTVEGKLTEGYMGIYVGAWIAPLIAKMWAPAPLPSTSTTTEVKQVTTEVK